MDLQELKIKLAVYQLALDIYNSDTLRLSYGRIQKSNEFLTNTGLCHCLRQIYLIKYGKYLNYSRLDENHPKLRLKFHLNGYRYVAKPGVRPLRIKILKDAIRITKCKITKLNKLNK